MLFKEIRFAIRRLIKEANYSLINLIGLTCGISFSFLIFLFVSDEEGYDHHIPDHEQIFRVSADFEVNGQRNIFSNSPRPMGETLVKEYPGILASTKVMGYNGLEIHSGYLWFKEDRVNSNHIFAVDSGFLKIFTPKLIRGTSKSLDNPNSIVLSESIARSLFGNEEAMGQIITLENKQEVIVTGVFEDHKNKMHLPYEVLISYSTFYPSRESEIWWYGGHVYTYIKGDENFNPQRINAKWEDFFDKYMKSTFDELNGSAKIILQPIHAIHLSSEYIWEPYAHGSKENLFILKIIGVFLLLVACFNYANLALSQSFYRQQEISIRKILGSTKIQLIRQHLIASILTALFAGILSIALLVAMLPLFNHITEGVLAINFMDSPHLLLIVLMLSITCGVVSGAYPALFESSMAIFTSDASQSAIAKTSRIRKLFVVGQQVISIGLIVFTLIVMDQINYVRNADIGFEKDNLVLIELKDRELRKNIGAINKALSNVHGIISTSSVTETPKTGPNEFSYHLRNSDGIFNINPSQTITVSDHFISTMKLDLLAGRAFRKEDHEYQGIIINSFLAEKIGYTNPRDAVGVEAKFDLEEDPRKVIGVVKDFSYGSVQNEKQAMTIGYFSDLSANILVRLHPKNQQETLSEIASILAEKGNTLPFSYSFFQDEYDFLLKRENKLYQLLVIACILIISISCLGLLGLVTQTVSQRTKEIGIRKILGARSTQLYLTVMKHFMQYYFIALIIGISVSWHLGNLWLENYAFRTAIGWENGLIAGTLGVLIIIISLSYHVLSVVNANPVNNLRYE